MSEKTPCDRAGVGVEAREDRLAVGDAIRSMIGKQKERKPIKRSEEKTYRAADHGSADGPCVRGAQPPAEIMEIDLPGGSAAEACRRSSAAPWEAAALGLGAAAALGFWRRRL